MIYKEPRTKYQEPNKSGNKISRPKKSEKKKLKKYDAIPFVNLRI